MSSTNTAILREANAANAAGDYEGFLAHCTDDTVWHFIGEQTLEGKEAVRQYMADAYKEPPRFEVETMIDGGDYVTAIGTITLKDEAGNDTHHDYCDVWRFAGGKMAELKAFVIAKK